MGDIWRIHFHDDGECEIWFHGGDEVRFHGLLSRKLKAVCEAVVLFESDKRWLQGFDLIEDIREALKE